MGRETTSLLFPFHDAWNKKGGRRKGRKKSTLRPPSAVAFFVSFSRDKQFGGGRKKKEKGKGGDPLLSCRFEGRKRKKREVSDDAWCYFLSPVSEQES